jgi:hypothetical protein
LRGADNRVRARAAHPIDGHRRNIDGDAAMNPLLLFWLKNQVAKEAAEDKADEPVPGPDRAMIADRRRDPASPGRGKS